MQTSEAAVETLMKIARWKGIAVLLPCTILYAAGVASAAEIAIDESLSSAQMSEPDALRSSDQNLAARAAAEVSASHPDFAFFANPQSLTGLWYDPQFTGSGFNILVSSAGLVFTYYGWDLNHNRLWLTSEIGPQQVGADNPYTLKMYQTAGGVFASPAPPSTNTQWGTLTITFNTCSTATATLEGNDGTVTENLNQLVGVISAPAC